MVFYVVVFFLFYHVMIVICNSPKRRRISWIKISGYATIAEEQKRIHSISGEVIYKAVDGIIQIKTDENQRYESKYSLEDTFSGELTSETYKKAKEEQQSMD